MGMDISDVKAAWLAGLFEGEGCFSIAKNGGTRVTIGMTDRDVVERINALIPSVIQTVDKAPSRPLHWSPLYVWRISDPVKVREFIVLIRPWLGVRRTARADEVIAHLDTRLGTGGWHKAKTHCAEGHEYTPENTYIRPGTDHRHCRTCRTQWTGKYQAKKQQERLEARLGNKP